VPEPNPSAQRGYVSRVIEKMRDPVTTRAQDGEVIRDAIADLAALLDLAEWAQMVHVDGHVERGHNATKAIVQSRV